MEKWLRNVHPATAQSMASRVVELHFHGSKPDEHIVKYKVMTQLAGFVNDFHGIEQRANAVLTWNSDCPFGQQSLMLKLSNDIEAEHEIVINYGNKHLCGKRITNLLIKRARAGAIGMKKRSKTDTQQGSTPPEGS